jgi:hypothetical protein
MTFDNFFLSELYGLYLKGLVGGTLFGNFFPAALAWGIFINTPANDQ